MIVEAIRWGLGYLHHQIPPRTPEQVTVMLEAEAKRRNPGEGFKAVAPSSEPSASEPIIPVQPPPAPTS